MRLETKRLILREMTAEDFDGLCGILQDPEVMYAYEHAFSDQEVRDWLTRQQRRYREDGFGLLAMIRREDGGFIGQAGLTMPEVRDRRVPEIGYLLRRDCWEKGYATEAAAACKEYAFQVLGLPEVWSIIRDTNRASRAVAKRNGMVPEGVLIKRYWGVDMPHILYRVTKK